MDKIIEKKKGLRPKHLLYALAIGVFAVMIFYVVKSAKNSSYSTEADKLTIAEVKNGRFNDYISVVSTVEPITTVFLDVDEGGKVEEILIEEGEMVRKGDVILKLRNNDLSLQILNSESQLAYTTNELRNTMINMERQKTNNKQQLLSIDYELIKNKRNAEQNKVLFQKGFLSKEEYLISEEKYSLSLKDRELRYEQMIQDSVFRDNQRMQMDLNLRNIQRNLEMVRERMENLNVKAIVDGQLGLLDAEIGQSINRGQRIGQINILDNFKVSAMVDEHYIDRVQKGLPATFDRQGKSFDLITHKVYPEVRNGQFKIDFHFGNVIPDNLRTGQTYYVKLELSEPVNAMLLPKSSFFQSTGGQWIFVLDPSGKFATKRNIKIGRQNPEWFEVLDGLSVGEKVITSSYELFGNNNKIELKY